MGHPLAPASNLDDNASFGFAVITLRCGKRRKAKEVKLIDKLLIALRLMPHLMTMNDSEA